MARCPYLDYESHGILFGSEEFICKLCGKHMDVDDPQVKYTCKVDYGEEYKKCRVYKDLSY